MKAIYTTPDASEATALLEKYDVQYVVVGPRERAAYGVSGLPKLSQVGDVVFADGGVTIYRVRE